MRSPAPTPSKTHTFPYEIYLLCPYEYVKSSVSHQYEIRVPHHCSVLTFTFIYLSLIFMSCVHVHIADNDSRKSFPWLPLFRHSGQTPQFRYGTSYSTVQCPPITITQNTGTVTHYGSTLFTTSPDSPRRTVPPPAPESAASRRAPGPLSHAAARSRR